MGMFADYVRRANESEQTVKDQSLSGEFSAGLRGAGNAIAGQLNSYAGLAAENLGADEFAADRRRSADEYMQRSNELGEGAVPLEDALDSPSNALRWGARTAGSVLPYLGLTAAGTMAAPAALGTGIARGIVGGGIGMAGPSAGAIVQRQEADPETMQDSAGDRFGRATGGGLLAGGALSLPFGSVLGKAGSGALMGVGKRVAASPSLLGATAKNLGEGAATAGIGMGGGNVVEQKFTNFNNDIDWNEAGQMAKEGAAMGAFLHAPLIPGAYMRGRTNQVGDAIVGAKDRVIEGMKTEEGRWKGFSQAADIAGDISKNTWDATKKAMPEGWQEHATAAGEWVKANYKTNFDEAKATVKQWAADIAIDENTLPSIKAAVAEAVKNPRDRTNQTIIAMANFAKEGFKKFNEEPTVVKPRVSPLERLNEIKDVDRTDDADVAAIAKGEPAGGIKQFIGKSVEQVNELLNLSENKTVQKVQKWGEELLNDNGLNPTERARIAETLRNEGDAASARIIAEATRAARVSRKYLNKAKALADTFKKRPDDGTKKSEDLEGFRAALRQGVLPYLYKNMPELFAENGQEFRHPAALKVTADNLNRAIEDMARGEMSSGSMARLIDMLGEHTMPVMERLMAATGRSLGQGKDANRVFLDGQQRAPTNGKGAMGENNTMQDQLTNLMRDREAMPSDLFTQQFMQLARLSNKDAEISQIVRHALTPEWQERLTMDEVRDISKQFTQWAEGLHLTKVSGSRKGASRLSAALPETPDMFGRDVPHLGNRMWPGDNPVEKVNYTGIADPLASRPAGKAEGGKGPNDAEPGTPLFQTDAGLYNEKGVREKFADYFGESADQVSEAFEKLARDRYLKEPTPVDRFDADGNRIEEAELERVVRGGNFVGKGGKAKAANEEGGIKKRGEHQTDGDGKMIREPDQVESMLQNPAKWQAGGRKGFNKASQLMMEMEAEFPAHRVFWEQADGAGKGWGYIIAEREKVPGRLDHNDIQSMLADRSVSRDGIPRIRKADTVVVELSSGTRLEFDATRVAWHAAKKLPYIDGESSATRQAKAAVEGIASLFDKYGDQLKKGAEIKIDPEAVVGKLGTTKEGDTVPLLWKDVKNYMARDANYERTQEFERNAADLNERERLADEDFTESQTLTEADAAGGSFEGRGARRGGATKLSYDTTDMDWRDQWRADNDQAGELSFEPGTIKENLSTKLLREEGKYEGQDSDNIHRAALERGSSSERKGDADRIGETSAKLKHTSNPDGTASSSLKVLSREQNAHINKINKTLDYWYEIGTPAAHALVNKVDALLNPRSDKNLAAGSARNAMSARDLTELLSIRNTLSPGPAAAIVNKMYAKYKRFLPEAVQDVVATKGPIGKSKTKFVDGKVVDKNGKPLVQSPQEWESGLNRNQEAKRIAAANKVPAARPEFGVFTSLPELGLADQGDLFPIGVPKSARPGSADTRSNALKKSREIIEAEIDTIRFEHGRDPDLMPPAVQERYFELQDQHRNLKSIENGKLVGETEAKVAPKPEFGDPVGLWELQRAEERAPDAEIRKLYDAARRGDIDYEYINKEGRFYIKNRGPEGDVVHFAPRLEGSPDPKAPAAKKAALLKAASSSDPALLKELSTSTDVKGLQRTLEVLNDAYGSRLTERVAAKVGPNKFRQLGADMDELLNYFAEKDNFSRSALRENPVIKAGMEKLREARRNGDAEATEALHSFLQKEHQFFSLENARDTQAAVVDGLNKAKPRTLSSYMDIVINSKDVPSIIREVARAVKDVSPDTKVSSVHDLKDLGVFNSADNTISVRGGLKGPTQILLHEGVHAATVKALVKNPELSNAVLELMDHVAKTNKELVDAYGMKDSGEFLAEGLTNRGFQKSLEAIPASDAVRKYLGKHVANAWQAFVAITRKALGLPEGKDTALTQLLDLGRQAMYETKKAGDNTVTPKEYADWVARPIEPVGDLVQSINRVKARLPDKAMAAELDALVTKAEQEGGAAYATVFAAEKAAQVFDNWTRNGREMGADDVRKTVDKILGAHLDVEEARVASRSGEEAAIDATNKRIAELIKENPDITYGMQLESKKSLANNTAGPHGPLVQAKIERLAKKLLGPTVKASLEAMGHAGDFRRDSQLHVDVLRVSTTAKNPMGTLHHEALHAFFGHLRNAKMNDVTHLLEKYSASPHIMKQLRERLKDSPEALKQLREPEERAAYMFQFYKTDKSFKIMPQTRTLFAKINDMLHKVMGLWTNQSRAIEIMDYFGRGDFKNDMGDMNVVHAKLMETNRIAAVESMKKHVGALGRLGDSMLGMGGHRLRDTGIPSLIKIADLVKSDSRGQGGDRGHLPAAREARAQVMNKYADEMSRYTKEEHAAALEAMQKGVKATGKARQVQRLTERTLGGVDPSTGALTGMFGYMVDKGVNIGLLKDKNGAHYFPRVWDAHYISKNQAAFTAMMDKYVQSGQFKGDPQAMMRNLMVGDGSTYGIETRQPGMQFKKERHLQFIDHADAAPFLNKDLLGTIDNYVTQGTRRAEWASRFGDDAKILTGLLEKAKKEGATPLQIMQAETYLRGIDGTLGDNIDPGLRRMFGNAIIYQNIRLLPLALFSSLVDPLGIAVRGGTPKQAFGAFVKGMKEIPNGFRDIQNRKVSPEERTAELLGVIDNAWLHSTMGSLYTQGLVGETGRKINDTFFKYNMMEGFNRSMRSAASAAAIKFIETHADGKASTHSSRWMQELGFGVGADSAIHLKADGSLKLTEADGLTPAQAAKVRQAVNQWVDGAILRPDAADKPMWMNDPHWALVAHLKQFTWSFQETILKRIGHEWKNGNFSPALAMASYIPMMIAADSAKGLIQGGGSQPDWKDNWGPSEYFWSGAQRTGVFGVSQIGIDSMSSIQRGGAGVGNLAGPMLEQLGDGISVIGGRKQFDSFAMRALPANAVYSQWVKEGVDPPPEFNFQE